MLRGLHHVTAIASDPIANLRFYREFLGLRLVKKTVNFDDPGTYHLYYGGPTGAPGTLVTFFVWPGSPRARKGTSQPVEIAFETGRNSLKEWQERCVQFNVPVTGPFRRFGDDYLSMEDPDGITLALMATSAVDPASTAVRRLHAVTLSEADPLSSAKLLTGLMGLQRISEEGTRTRIAFPDEGFVDLLRSEPNRGSAGSGVIHHVAVRCAFADELETWRARVIEAGMRSTIVIDRRYFQSIYFRERDANRAGGVLFEIASDTPGFAVDEPVDHLGESLMLPPWLEPTRESILRRLPPLA